MDADLGDKVPQPPEKPTEGPGAAFAAAFPSKSLRDRAIAAINATDFYPEAGRNRIRSMVETRPDWLISRQRAWGTPLAMFVDKETGLPLMDEAVNRRILDAIREGGSDAWFELPDAHFLGDRDPAQLSLIHI